MKWCDFACSEADTQATEAAMGGCRREMAIYCKKYKKLVKKNELCVEDKRQMLAQDEEYQRLFGKKSPP